MWSFASLMGDCGKLADSIHGGYVFSYEAAVGHYEGAIRGSKKMQGIASDWAVTYNNLGHAYRRLG
jgi:hypothetical protein